MENGIENFGVYNKICSAGEGRYNRKNHRDVAKIIRENLSVKGEEEKNLSFLWGALWRHGTFQRYLGGRFVSIQRYYCPSCGKTFSSGYPFLAPYFRHSLVFIISAFLLYTYLHMGIREIVRRLFGGDSHRRCVERAIIFMRFAPHKIRALSKEVKERYIKEKKEGET